MISLKETKEADNIMHLQRKKFVTQLRLLDDCSKLIKVSFLRNYEKKGRQMQAQETVKGSTTKWKRYLRANKDRKL